MTPEPSDLNAVRRARPGTRPEEYETTFTRLRADLLGHNGQLQRYLVLDDVLLETLGEQGRLGRHWTTLDSGMPLSSLDVPSEADDTWSTVRIVARLDGHDGVDWKGSVLRRLNAPEEREVLLTDVAELVVVRVDRIGRDDATETVRRDLTGRRFSAARVVWRPSLFLS